MSHHLSFLFLNRGWNSVPSRNAFCVGTPFLVPTLFLQPPLSSCHFTSLLHLWCCDECACPNPCNQCDQVRWVPSTLHCGAWCLWCGVLNHHCYTHSLIPTFIGCATCSDCMVAWCCVVWSSVDWVHWQSHTKKENNTGVLVWHVVCHGVVYGVSERA